MGSDLASRERQRVLEAPGRTGAAFGGSWAPRAERATAAPSPLLLHEPYQRVGDSRSRRRLPPGSLGVLCPYPQHVAAPKLGDLRLRIAPADELEGHVERLRGVAPADDASAAVEVGA